MIPKIDLSPLWNDKENGIKKVAEQVKWIYTTIGFATIVNILVRKDEKTDC